MSDNQQRDDKWRRNTTKACQRANHEDMDDAYDKLIRRYQREIRDLNDTYTRGKPDQLELTEQLHKYLYAKMSLIADVHSPYSVLQDLTIMVKAFATKSGLNETNESS